MAAILSCRAMLNYGRLRRGCLIEFLYPTGSELTNLPLEISRRWRPRLVVIAG